MNGFAIIIAFATALLRQARGFMRFRGATAVSAVRECQRFPSSHRSQSRGTGSVQRARRGSSRPLLTIPNESLSETAHLSSIPCAEHTRPCPQAIPQPFLHRSEPIPAPAQLGEEWQHSCTTHTRALLAPRPLISPQMDAGCPIWQSNAEGCAPGARFAIGLRFR